MILYEPVLKKRSDGTMPQQNSILGDPFELFLGINSRLSFHFFTVDDQIKPYAWKVLVSDVEIDKSNLKHEILSYINIKQLISDYNYLLSNGIKLQFIVFNDNVNWHTHNGTIYLIDFKVNIDNSSVDFSVREFDKTSFQIHLREIQSHDMIMNKPLIYSTTELEGYFADQCQRDLNPMGKAIFPGDVDLILYSNNKTINIIEFKKHTKYGDGSIEDQSFLKYWFKDKKKYTGIALLAKKLNKDFFYNLIYSTKNDELKKIKIEKISTSLELMGNLVKVFESKNDASIFLENFIGRE